MMASSKRDVLIGLHTNKAFVAEVDAFVGCGQPGDQNYFGNRSELFRVALMRLLSDLRSAQVVKPVQPVAPGTRV